MIIAPLLLGASAATLAGLGTGRLADRRTDRAEARRLLDFRPDDPPRFDPASIAGLPEPARRYLSGAIRPGTALTPVATLAMTGRFDLGSRDAPRPLAMTAHQVLAFPHGFLWAMNARRGAMTLSGSDSASWTRFWLAGLVPVARTGGSEDHRRSAFGRMLAEAAIWTPAALMPSPVVRWEAPDLGTARVTASHDGPTQSIDIAIAPDGRATAVRLERWSNANPDRRWQLQPFGATLSDHREFEGFRLPARIEACNFFGTPDYFPFMSAAITALTFPPPDSRP